MNKIKYIILTLIMSLGYAVHAQGILDRYLVEAAENNPGLKSSFNEYQASLEKVPQVGALPDPTVSFSYLIQPIETRLGPQQAKISASQMFPWFGTLKAKEDAATEMAKSKYENFEEQKSKLFFDVKSTYYNLYFTGKAIDITMENIDILNTFRKLALVKVESGSASTVDVIRVEIEVSDMENQLALLKDKFYVQQVEFNNLLNVEEQRGVQLPDTLNAPDLMMSTETILDSIRNSNHSIMQLNLMSDAYGKQKEVAEKVGKPSFSIGVDYMVIGDNPGAGASSGTDAIAFPMVGIKIPLYRKKYRAMVNEAVYMQESTQNKKSDKINMLETTYSKSKKEYDDADRRIPLFEKQSDRANQAIKLLETEYSTSGKNFEEVLRMERQLLKYKLELEKARADKNASIAFINYLMGR